MLALKVLNDGGASDHLGLVVELCPFGPVMQFHATQGCCRFSPGRAALTFSVPKKANRRTPSIGGCGNPEQSTQPRQEEDDEEGEASSCPAVSAEDEWSWGLPPLLASKWGRDLLRGVAYLHEMGVAHRDLKVRVFWRSRSGSCKNKLQAEEKRTILAKCPGCLLRIHS